jgi:hypothetical protein
MLLQHPGMGDRLLDIDRVSRHRLAQRADERERVDPGAVLRLGLGGALSGDDAIVFVLLPGALVGMHCDADPGRLGSLDEEVQ